jgi:hypothetical protein
MKGKNIKTQQNKIKREIINKKKVFLKIMTSKQNEMLE